jgi:peptidyl-prolyl cis-trans isomerase-like 4
LIIAPASPVPTAQQLASLRVGDSEDLEEHGTEDDVAATRRARDARAQALTLEMVGDLPFADVAPPENVLFVCKLNQVTKSEDLELIFSRFGKIMSCEIICDPKSGDSLQYAFVEFSEREEAERAYVKMDNVLVDDRRIHVDFSQSVSKLHDNWVFKRTGGRAPPNKSGSGSRRRNSSPPPPTPRPHGRGKDDREMVFDLGEHDERERRRPPPQKDNRSRGGGDYNRGGNRREPHDQGGHRDRRDEERRAVDRRDDRRRSRSPIARSNR